MKKKNNGFTLIELLAVIVILAIIALIAVPVVMNIITKSKKSAFKDSAYGIIKAGELYYADRLLEPVGMTEDKMFTFPNDTTGLDIKGSKPSDGSIIITKEGKVAIGVTDGKYCITKGFEDNDVTVTEDVENCSNPEAPKTLSQLATTGTFTRVDGTDASEITEVHDCAKDKTEGACAPGTEFAIKVNEKDVYRFYVMSDTGEKVTLIMDRNLVQYSAWNAEKVSAGPVDALNSLQISTDGWTNVQETEYTTADSGGGLSYSAITRTMRARLITYAEVNDLKTENSGIMPTYLYENLEKGIHSSYGYWTSAAVTWGGGIACGVFDTGSLGYASSHADDVSAPNAAGIRPVITLSK